MKNRCLATLALLLCTTAALAKPDPLHAQRWVEGKQYVRLDPALEVHPGAGKVQVLEMFLYTCPHCYQLEPKLQAWARARAHVTLKRMPAILGPSWGELAKVFYTTQVLGLLDRLHMPIYRSIHEAGSRVHDLDSILQFLAGQDVEMDAFQDAYRSPMVLEKVNRARQLSVQYRLRGVPAVIVNGKYKTAPFMVSSQEEMLELLDDLVARESGS